MKMIGITGGIGSGKSVVSRILRLRGIPVYDCDREAKRIMDTSAEVLTALHDRFGDEVCPVGGPIHRPNLSRHVFGDDRHREWLNALVHRLVREDLAAWNDRHVADGADVCFVESAIMATSGLAALCDEVWVVDAPEEVRIQRVTGRDGLPETEIRRRIDSQRREMEFLKKSGVRVKVIDNSDISPLLPQCG